MKKILYLGLEPPVDTDEISWIHFPLIQVTPYSPFSYEIELAFSKIDSFTHIILTSKMAVTFFFDILKMRKIPLSSLQEKTFISIGEVTKERILNNFKSKNLHVAKNETTDGIIELIESLEIRNPLFFWPHSKLSSRKLIEFIDSKFPKCTIDYPIISCPIYTTIPLFSERKPPEVDAIFFSSPSTVNAYINFYGLPPDTTTLYTQGEVTKAHLFKILKSTSC